MRREYFLTHFMTLVLFWYWNQTNYIAKKILQPNIPHERSCKILNKFLEPNWFQQHSKKDKIQWTNGMCPRNAKFVQYLKISIIYHVTRVQKGNHVTNSVDAEKAFNKIQNALLIKNNKLGTEGNFFNLTEHLCKINIWNHVYSHTTLHIPISSEIILNAEKRNPFSKIRNKARCPPSPPLFIIALEFLPSAVK